MGETLERNPRMAKISSFWTFQLIAWTMRADASKMLTVKCDIDHLAGFVTLMTSGPPQAHRCLPEISKPAIILLSYSM